MEHSPKFQPPKHFLTIWNPCSKSGHIAWRHWAQLCRETNIAAVELYQFKPESVLEEKRRPMTTVMCLKDFAVCLTVWTAFLMISEKLQESASVFSNSLNRRTGLRNLFHELCSSLPFNVHAISTTFEFVSSRLALRTSVGDRALPESDMCYNFHVIPDHN